MNKKKKSGGGFFSKCPLTLMIIGSVLIVTIMAIVMIATGARRNNWGLDHPAFEALWSNEKETDAQTEPTQGPNSTEPLVIPSITPATTAPSASVEPSSSVEPEPSQETPAGETPQEGSSQEVTEPSSSEPASSETPVVTGRVPRPMSYVDRAPVEVLEPKYYDDPQKTPLTKEYPYVPADDNYFADALFIGDSRIQGLSYYGNIQTATYAYLEGVSLFQIMVTELEISNGGKGTIQQILEQGQYKKVYIMAGLNELGDHTAQEYGQWMAHCVESIKTWEPEAVVTVMGSMPISADKSAKSTWLNNDNINARNYWEAVFACDNTDVFFLSSALPELLDESGALSPACSNDGIHLKAEYYIYWSQHIRAHGLTADMWS